MVIDLEKVISECKVKGAKKIYLQAPEGLKTKVQEFASLFEKEGIEVIISCEACWGACDIRDHGAKLLGCDMFIHIGHTQFGNIKSEIPIIYVPYRMEYDTIPVLEKEWNKIEPYQTFNIVSTAQHIDCLGDVRGFLEKKGKKVLDFGKPSLSQTPGQVLGCDQVAALYGDFDCVLFIGSGKFHPFGIARKTEKPVLALSTDTDEIVDYSKERDRFLRIKFAQIEKAKDSKNFGIVVSTKPGQRYIRQAETLKKKLEKSGKNVWILVMDFISKDKLLGLKLDALVNCACPRLDEDYHLFGMPVLNPEDVGKITG